MLHSTHMLFSLFLSLPIYLVFPVLGEYITPVYWYIIAIFAALVPDIDHPNGYISQGNWSLLSTAVRKTTTHRGWTHSIFGGIVFSIVSIAVFYFFDANLLYSIPFFFGYMSHLISDSLNPTGVNWLSPYDKTKYGIGLVRTGSDVEKGFQSLITFVIAGIIVYDIMYGNGVLFG